MIQPFGRPYSKTSEGNQTSDKASASASHKGTKSVRQLVYQHHTSHLLFENFHLLTSNHRF